MDQIYSHHITSDKAFTCKFEIERQNISENSRKIISKVEVNLDGDFEKIKGKAEKLENFLDAALGNMSNSISNNNQNEIFFDEADNKRVHNTIIMANQLLKNNLKETSSYSSLGTKYPNAGLEENIFLSIIKIAIAILFVALVVMIIKVKKINKE